MRPSSLIQSLFLVLLSNSSSSIHAFAPSVSRQQQLTTSLDSSPDATEDNSSKNTFQVTVDMPPSGSDIQCRLNIDSMLSVPTELVVVRYKVPFALNVAPARGLAVVTQAGPGGEQPGDVLRYTSQFTLGLPQGDGIGTTLGSFAGAVSWQCSIFDVINAKAWEQVVEALTSNIESRTDEVVLIFERPLDGLVPPELK